MNEDFSIPPELCLVVRAFSRTGTLREAARLLQCDPAALVRKAQRIESQYRLLQKVRGRWSLTEAGLRAVQWVEQSVIAQRALLEAKPRLRVSSTMWMAEQVLIPSFARLNAITRDRYAWGLRAAAASFEQELVQGTSDYVIACHPPEDPAIAHRRVAEERWIAIVPASWSKAVKGLSKEELNAFLRAKPFVRHSNLNPAQALKNLGDAHQESGLVLDNLIGVRSAVASGLGWSCVPEMAARSLLKERKLVEVPLEVSFSGNLCVWWLRARPDNARRVGLLAKWLVSASRPK